MTNIEKEFDNGNYEIFQGLLRALKRSKIPNSNLYDKVIMAQRHYFSNGHIKVSLEDQQKSNELLEDAMKKLNLASLSNDLLWAVHNHIQ